MRCDDDVIRPQSSTHLGMNSLSSTYFSKVEDIYKNISQKIKSLLVPKHQEAFKGK
jgi:hypothetical protein